MAEEKNFLQIYTKRQRVLKINAEKERLSAFFGKKDDLASGLIDLAATQKVVLDETAELIKRDGVVEEYRNGENQYGRKKSSAVEVHTKYSSEYVKTITALANLRGADGGEANDEFLQFIARRKK